MTALLINGSPKSRDTASGVLLGDLKARLPEGVSTRELSLRTAALSGEALEQFRQAGAWVFAFPLYVDSLPSHLLSCLVELERSLSGTPGKTVYALVNCGFYEGIQTAPAMEVMANWCARTGFVWGGGIGVGGGGALTELPDTEKGPKAPVYHALAILGERIAGQGTGENLFCSIAFPRFLYQMAAQMGWRKKIKANGGRTTDLALRPEKEMRRAEDGTAEG